MPSDDLSQIRRDLQQLKQELENAREEEIRKSLDAGEREKPRRQPLLDFGLFLLAYFFWLVALVTAEIFIGLGIHPYTSLFAAPFAWLTLFWLRKAPLYALAVTVCGVLLLIGTAYLASFFYDTAWSSNCYYKPVTAMLKLGWNPFRGSMIPFANANGALPYNAGWLSYQVDNQPKASFMIAASIYALTGDIEYGKIFNLVSMVACICIVAPLLADAFKLRFAAAIAAVMLTAMNLITLSQLMLFYHDGFAYQLLTVAAASFFYLLFKPRGAYASAARVAAFASLCLAVNVKMSAVLYAAVLCGVYVVGRAAEIRRAGNTEGRNGEILRMIGYFAGMAVCALGILGAGTFVTNRMAHGDPFYGMLGSNSMNSLLPYLMSDNIRELPLYQQFFVSMFSPTSNTLFSAVQMKLPFTFSMDEWTLATNDANVAGWGIVFGGIFCLSSVIVLVTAVRMLRHDRRVSWLLFGVLALVIVPVFFIPYLFCARYYLQPFWVPLAALICLFAPCIRVKKTGGCKYPRARFLKFLLAPVLCGLLVLNAYTSVNYFQFQYEETRQAKTELSALAKELSSGSRVMDVATIERGLFYGLFINLNDRGIAYNFCETLAEPGVPLLHYLTCLTRDRGAAAEADAVSFLRALYDNGYLVVIASGGGKLPAAMAQPLQALGLLQTGAVNPDAGYMAVIDPYGAVNYELNDYGQYSAYMCDTGVLVQSTSAVLAILINGTDYAYSMNGFNIVVYDTENRVPVASVTIDAQANPMLTRFPVRPGQEGEAVPAV